METINTMAILVAAAIVGLAVCVAIYKKKHNTRADLSPRND